MRFFPFRLYLGYALLIGLALMALMPTYTHFDVHDYFFWWAEKIKVDGIARVYDSNCDYLPFYQYFLWFFGSLFPSVEAMRTDIMHLKQFNLPFHLFTGYFIASLLYQREADTYRVLYLTLFFLLHIAVLYPMMMWGQIDGMVACFLFASVCFAWWQRPLPALLFLLLAVNTKLQAIILVPLVVLLCVPAIRASFSWKTMLTILGTLILVQALILMPFILAGNVQQIFRVIQESFGKYPNVSMNAYNLWELVLFQSKDHLTNIPDTTLLMGFTMKNWGLFLFFTLSGSILLPFAARALHREATAPQSLALEQILLAAALICLLFFFVNTQMHERYSHPAMVFLLAYGLLKREIWITIPCTLAYLLNLEAVITYFDLDNYGILLFNKKFVALLYLLGIVWLSVRYVRSLRQTGTALSS